MLDGYEIPTLGSLQTQPQAFSKPGLFYFRPSHLPLIVRWTHYGRWTDDGSQVLNNLGQSIYDATTPLPEGATA